MFPIHPGRSKKEFRYQATAESSVADIQRNVQPHTSVGCAWVFAFHGITLTCVYYSKELDVKQGFERKPAYIIEPRYGMGDYGRMALSFTTCYSPDGLGSCALQFFQDPTEIEIILNAYGVTTAEELAGKECWVAADYGMIIYYDAKTV